MNLNDKTTVELVALHNEMNPENPVKRFRDRRTAKARVEALLALTDARPTALSPIMKDENDAMVEAAKKPEQRGYSFNADQGEASWPQAGRRLAASGTGSPSTCSPWARRGRPSTCCTV